MPDRLALPNHDAAELRAGRLAVNSAWLLRLRWVAVVGQLVTVAVAAEWFRVPLPLVPLLSIIAVTAATNALFQVGWRRWGHQEVQSAAWKCGEQLFLCVMTFDVLALTALLYFAGGPENPFVVFYFVNLSLAAVILPARSAWWLVGIALLGIAFLFAVHFPVPELRDVRPLGGLLANLPTTLQTQGLLVALAGCASVVVYFITCLTRELRQREAELRSAEQQRARSQRLEALATLAAGAGHELATPLGTIAVVAKELTRHLEGADVPASVLEDVALIRGELDHCRGILDRLSANAGQAVGEEVSPVTVGDLVDEVLHGLRRRARVERAVLPAVETRSIRVPLEALAQALRGVVRNALDATDLDGVVQLSATHEDGWLRLIVRDSGPGMPPEVLARAGDPFFTTKEPGKGMGLGLFLCRSVVERLGGTLELRSPPGEGMTVVVRLPMGE
jgi:two-component system sensor histidine kinase RegB